MSRGSPPEIVTTDRALEALCARIVEAGRFAFDTEFVAEESYQPTVCLIQIALDGHCALIDPMAGLDATPLWNLVADPAIETLVHAGSEDLALCRQAVGRPPANVFDIQIAGGFVGWGYPTSLARIVRLTAKTTLHKSQTLTDWRKRPLSPEQVRYAVEDVVHLPKAHRLLTARLAELGRSAWVAEECARLCAATLPADDPQVKLRRLKGSGSLTARELAVADAIMAERDILAREYDRPARTILKDHLLVELARRGWTDIKKMRTLRGINVSDAGLRRMAAAIERAKLTPVEELPEVTAVEEDPVEDILGTLASAVLKDYCRREGVAYSLLTNKAELRAVVARHADPKAETKPSMLDVGWRRAAVGGLLNEVLSGTARLRIRREKGELGLYVEPL